MQSWSINRKTSCSLEVSTVRLHAVSKYQPCDFGTATPTHTQQVTKNNSKHYCDKLVQSGYCPLFYRTNKHSTTTVNMNNVSAMCICTCFVLERTISLDPWSEVVVDRIRFVSLVYYVAAEEFCEVCMTPPLFHAYDCMILFFAALFFINNV